MNVLILINAAPQIRPFFSRVGDELRKRGHEVVYAVDSRYSEFHYPGVDLHGPTHVFSDYFEAHYATAKIPELYRDVNVWTAMIPDLDRAKYGTMYRTPEYYVRLLPNLVQFFDEIVRKHSIECVAYEGVSNTFSYIAQQVSARLGAAYTGFAISRLPNRTDVWDSQWSRNAAMPVVYRELLEGRRRLTAAERQRVGEYRATFATQTPDYMVSHAKVATNPIARYAKRQSLERVWRSFRHLAAVRDKHWYAYQAADPRTMYLRQFGMESVRTVRARIVGARFSQPADFAQDYFAYPMQFHPESSTSVAAPMYLDELSNIQNIAANLPYGVWLYAKDHRGANAARMPLSFYRQVSRIPNVKLIDARTNAQTFVRNAKAVVTTAGTMGYEAIVLGKPTYVLGRIFYDFHPLCVPLRAFDDAFELFSNWRSIRCTDAEIEAFIASYFACSLEGSLDLEARGDDPHIFASVVAAIERRGKIESSADSAAAP